MQHEFARVPGVTGNGKGAPMRPFVVVPQPCDYFAEAIAM